MTNYLQYRTKKMKNKYYKQLDYDYSRRYKTRNLSKVQSIVGSFPPDVLENAIDIGCNRGYVIKSLLENNKMVKKGLV